MPRKTKSQIIFELEDKCGYTIAECSIKVSEFEAKLKKAEGEWTREWTEHQATRKKLAEKEEELKTAFQLCSFEQGRVANLQRTMDIVIGWAGALGQNGLVERLFALRDGYCAPTP